MLDQQPPDNVGLALSGGGVRALLFGLGALRAVVAAREKRPGSKMSLLIGVSGGALAAAYAASRVDASQASLDEYDQTVLRPATWSIAHRSMMFSHWRVWGVLVGALGLIVGAMAAAALAPLPWPARISVAVAGVVSAGLLLSRRGGAIEKSMVRALYENDQPLAGVGGTTQLVLQATDLASGEATYLTSGGISSWRWGDAPAGDLSLVHAARASATFPIVFGPLRLKSPSFTGGHGETPPPAKLSLVDGGIYDNMGSEWLINRAGDDVCKIVVNASQNLPPRNGFYGVPLIGDVLVLLRERDIQYDATTAPRRRLLNRIVQDSAAGGTTVAIDKSIEEWVEKFAHADDEWGRRASALLVRMRAVGERGVWQRWKSSNPAVATSLGKLKLKTARDLVCAGYLATAIQMHILRGWPAPEIVDPDQLLPGLGEPVEREIDLAIATAGASITLEPTVGRYKQKPSKPSRGQANGPRDTKPER